MDISAFNIRVQTVTVTFLEMHEKPGALVIPGNDICFRRLEPPITAPQYRQIYYAVGESYSWLDRMLINDRELEDIINAEKVEIYLMYVQDQMAGFVEFVKEYRFIEILYFGLLPGFIGRGLGKLFLKWAVYKAWSFRPEWIQLNTCTLDHPHALSNYQKMGFVPVREAFETRKLLHQ